MKVLLETLLLYYLASTSCSQVIFPEDNKNLKITSDKIIRNRDVLGGTPQHEDYIDTLIVKGITKLALAFNTFDDGTLNSIVYSPVSVAGTEEVNSKSVYHLKCNVKTRNFVYYVNIVIVNKMMCFYILIND